MGRKKPVLLVLILVSAVLVALVAGCGGGSGSSSSTSSAADPPGKVSAEFLKPKSPNNKYVEFGSEAPASEREVASKVLEENLKAREEGDFATQCASLYIATIEELTGPKKSDAAKSTCPAALKKLAEPLKSTETVRADTLDGSIAALRIKGTKGYALYHGNDKKDYAMPMDKEGDKWTVGSLLTIELG